MNDLDRIEESLRATLARFSGIAAAYLFGSLARGEARRESDLDLGLVFHRRDARAVDQYWMLADLASRLESAAPGRPIDLVVLERQSATFRLQVLREGRLVYEADRERRIDFESETMIRAFDEAPLRRMERRARRQGLREWLESH